ncbi:MAG: STAS domain-containing protein [Caulobacter sp.]|nr:STAS domain-containing protein [Caulobacter sp.]
MSGVEHNLVSFVGDLTVANISQARDELGAALRQNGPVVVDIVGVGEIDLTFVQLLESARRKAAETGRELRLRHPADGAVLEVLRRGGFLDDEISERANFWLQGATQ